MISIIIRTCDRPALLRRAIACVIAQDYRPLQLIIVDDGKLPAKLEKLWENQQPDLIYTWVCPLPPGGRSQAANAGIAAAFGEYVGFLDDDDTIDPAHISILITAARAAGNPPVVYGRCQIVEADFDPDHETWIERDRYTLFADEFDRKRLIFENYIPIISALLKRNQILAINGFSTEIDLYEDWDLLYRLSCVGDFLHVPHLTSYYYHWSRTAQAALSSRGTEAEPLAYTQVLSKHWTAVTPAHIHYYFVLAGQRLGGYLQARREVERLIPYETKSIDLQNQFNQAQDIIKKLKHARTELIQELDLRANSIQLLTTDRDELLIELDKARQHAQKLALDLDTIRQSLGWRLLQRVRPFIKIIFSAKFHNDRGYFLVRRFVDSILRDGFWPTARKILDWRKRNQTYIPRLNGTRTEPAQTIKTFRKRQPVTIIIPVYNAADDLSSCLNSIRAHTDLTYHQLILIDDASPDPAIAQLFTEQEKLGGVTCFTNQTNQGFVGTVNRGITAATGDVIILNSDTLVPLNWIEKLQRAAYARPNIGTVTPLSNHASICAIPEPMRYNLIPKGFTIETFAAFIDQIALRHYPEIPAGIGFCLYIRRAVFNLIGLLDPIFERGYAEDTDFCLRARQAGFRNVMDDATFVYHSGGKSFESDTRSEILETKNRMIQRNLTRLAKRHPAYESQVRQTLADTLVYFHEYLNLRLKIMQER